MKMTVLLPAISAAYLIGSFPTALLYSRLRGRADIRALGDGNMGARNTRRHFGMRAGVLVAVVDILKGLLAVMLADLAGLPLGGQMLAGAAAILGHDFPLFAGFKGGQGFAATTGVFLYLFPLPALLGLAIYFTVYALTRSSDLGAGLAMGQLFLYEIFTGAPLLTLVYIVGVLLFVPLKKWLDSPRRRELAENAREESAPGG
jgi:glycerol-3-phosphate acyltransferase PlsY